MRMRSVRSVVLFSAASMLVGAAAVHQARAQGEPPPPGFAGKNAATPLYTVNDGNKVDPKTLMGWKTWRAMACERCHGASQEGLVGPPLVISMKMLTKEQFQTTIMNGRLPKGMPPFNASQMVQTNWERSEERRVGKECRSRW